MFWLKGMPYGHPLIPQRLRCYVMHAELAPGARYVLKEDAANKKALLLGEDSNVIASGELIDEPWVFLRECRWP